MSLFGKKTYQENKYALPYGIVLATAFFLAMIVFSICYGNKEYMADVMGREFEKNIIGQTSFMAGGFALILILDYGLSFSFDRKEKRRLVDIIGLSAASLEWLWVFACSLIYIINWQGERGTFEFALRIVTMIVIYLVPGVIAAFVLVLYAALMLVLLNAFDLTLTLPGIAGIILSIGMAVDANVIIYARIREEINAGTSVLGAIKSGFHKAMSAILDGNITTLIAAAVLHDTIEDTGVTKEVIQALFGERVADLVASETENKRKDQAAESTWKVRKEETLQLLRTVNDRDVKLICLGDKLANLREISRDYAALGDKVWERFHQKDKREHCWYYSSVYEILRDEFGDIPTIREYRDLLEKVFGWKDENE